MTTKGQTAEKGSDADIRCPACDYFILEPILVEMTGKVILKMICKKCGGKFLVTITSAQIDVNLL